MIFKGMVASEHDRKTDNHLYRKLYIQVRHIYQIQGYGRLMKICKKWQEKL